MDADNVPFRHWYEERRTAPRHTAPYGGVDRGADGLVLVEVRRGNGMERQLVWRSGFATASAGVRGFGRHYVPARLYVTDRIGMGVPGADMFSGGRLTASRLEGVADRIDDLFGVPVSRLIRLDATLIVVLAPDSGRG